jgi:hypothetical protein
LAAEHIFEPNVGSLKGKTVCTALAGVALNESPLPPNIIDQYQQVILTGDVMFINKIAFL